MTKFKKIIFYRSTKPISSELGTYHPLLTGIKLQTNKDHLYLKKVIQWGFFSLNQRDAISLSIDRTCFSDDVAHESFVIIVLKIYVLEIKMEITCVLEAEFFSE